MTELETIINDCKANKQSAFELLYKKYYRVLYGIALRYCRTTFEADDILQDSFIKIFKNIGSYKMDGSFEGWIKRIVQNTAINNYRSNLKLNLNVDISMNEYDVSDDSLNNIFESFETKEVIHLLNQLPEGYRVIINLFCIDGYTHKEIAEMLDIAIGTSKSQLFKAKEYLKKSIETKLNVQTT